MKQKTDLHKSEMLILAIKIQFYWSYCSQGMMQSKTVAAIGQAIEQAIRPWVVIVPLQLRHAVEIHNNFAS